MMMKEIIKSSVKKSEYEEKGLIDIVFSWSITDVLNKDLYKYKVKKIPMTFLSTSDYFGSFTPLLIEETHADLSASFATVTRSPACELCIEKEISANQFTERLLYFVYPLKPTESSNNNVGSYVPDMGDLFALTSVRPKSINDLSKPNRPYTIALALGSNNGSSEKFLIRTSEKIRTKTVFAVYLVNMTTNIRIWNALNNFSEGKIIKSVLKVESTETDEDCYLKTSQEVSGKSLSNMRNVISRFNLNDSQEEAILSSISAAASDQSYENNSNGPRVKLIWGPPGTGKTKTVSSLLFALRKLKCHTLPMSKCRTLTCAPTNIAVLQVATGLMNVMTNNYQSNYSKYRLGDIVLLGNGKRMNVDEKVDGVRDIFLDYRARILEKCFASEKGWTGSLELMIDLLNDVEKHYLSYLLQQKLMRLEMERELKRLREVSRVSEGEVDMTIEEFMKRRFDSISVGLKFCLENIYKHLPSSFISLDVVKKMFEALELLKSFEDLLHSLSIGHQNTQKSDNQVKRDINLFIILTRQSREDCIEILKNLRDSFCIPTFSEDGSFDTHKIKEFCLSNSCIVLCTASTSAKLFIEGLKPFDVLIIDEAAQLKECESAIPCFLLMREVDEHQLPALVKSKICDDADFGRSMFERLVMQGCKKHLLNVQYRMHPSISLLPNKEFYGNQILDAPMLHEKSYDRRFLEGKMYGSYSFINIGCGKEEFGYGHSSKNVMEVAVVCELVSRLFDASIVKRQKVSVGIISPYKAQVFAIQEKLANSYENSIYFSVSVRSVDGFQGGEEDVVIVSTVRSNISGSVGFLSNHNRTNVVLTRARYCLWILGNKPTLIKSGSVWKKVVVDAIDRNCYFNVDEDAKLTQAITSSLVELNRFDILVSDDSPMFRNTRWKVKFSDDFGKTIGKTKNNEVRKEAFLLLEKLATGWREPYNYNRYDDDNIFSDSKVLIEQFKLREDLGDFRLVWTVDIIKDNSRISSYIQVLKVWDMLPSFQLPKLLKHLLRLFEDYSVKKVIQCTFKRSEGSLEVPMSWPVNVNVDDKKNTVLEDEYELIMSRPLASLSLMDDL